MLNLISYDKPLLIPFNWDVSGIHDDISNQVYMKFNLFHVDVITKLPGLEKRFLMFTHL